MGIKINTFKNIVNNLNSRQNEFDAQTQPGKLDQYRVSPGGLTERRRRRRGRGLRQGRGEDQAAKRPYTTGGCGSSSR